MQFLIYADIEGVLCDYSFYTREFSPVVFNDGEIGLGFLAHKESKTICLCLFTAVKYFITPERALRERHRFIIKDDKSQKPNSEKFWTIFKLCYTQIVPCLKATWEVDAHVASCVMCEVYRSRTFRKRFIKYIHRNVGFLEQFVKVINDFDGCVEVNFVIEIKPQYPIQKLDYAWCYRMEGQVVKKMILEEAMAWLSTLGGAYSALGDYFQFHAEEAGKISYKQLRIAIEMGDPVVASQCRLFFAQSLMQRGFYKQSKVIIRHERKLAKNLPVEDKRLSAMVRAFRTRLKFLMRKNCINKK
ncbi:hypothetical protein KUTeg_009633 [Tegillarca granosa]|uniref:Uncharacterized protein n=1 Tax=Tegillarca granosa TaxID=220873 RepID=A0ABQ9F4G5_TEGGR|nr:hypothetical protein KUTeg_009633 [Tegillarca granosa]